MYCFKKVKLEDTGLYNLSIRSGNKVAETVCIPHSEQNINPNLRD